MMALASQVHRLNSLDRRLIGLTLYLWGNCQFTATVDQGYFYFDDMAKVSFDFDDTLSLPQVQAFAKKLVDAGHEVWIVTSRLSNKQAHNNNWNDDLEFVAKCLGIENIKYCNYTPKAKFFANTDFVFHLDDDAEAVKAINENTSVRAVHYVDTYCRSKQKECLKILEEL